MTRVLNCWPVPEQSGLARRTFRCAYAAERGVTQQTHELNCKASLQSVCVWGGPTMYAHPRGHHPGTLKGLQKMKTLPVGRNQSEHAIWLSEFGGKGSSNFTNESFSLLDKPGQKAIGSLYARIGINDHI